MENKNVEELEVSANAKVIMNAYFFPAFADEKERYNMVRNGDIIATLYYDAEINKYYIDDGMGDLNSVEEIEAENEDDAVKSYKIMCETLVDNWNLIGNTKPEKYTLEKWKEILNNNDDGLQYI